MPSRTAARVTIAPLEQQPLERVVAEIAGAAADSCAAAAPAAARPPSRRTARARPHRASPRPTAGRGRSREHAGVGANHRAAEPALHLRARASACDRSRRGRRRDVRSAPSIALARSPRCTRPCRDTRTPHRCGTTARARQARQALGRGADRRRRRRRGAKRAATLALLAERHPRGARRPRPSASSTAAKYPRSAAPYSRLISAASWPATAAGRPPCTNAVRPIVAITGRSSSHAPKRPRARERGAMAEEARADSALRTRPRAPDRRRRRARGARKRSHAAARCSADSSAR